MDNTKSATKRLTLLAMLLAMIFGLSALEQMLPPLPFLPPNVRLGLSNVVTMYTLFFLGRRPAFLLALLKSGFVALLRGFFAGLLSLCGGMLSLLCIALLAALLGGRASYLLLSVVGALAHNIGQLLLASLLLGSGLSLFYLPVLLLSGLGFGVLTGVLLRMLLPVFGRVLPLSTQKERL